MRRSLIPSGAAALILIAWTATDAFPQGRKTGGPGSPILVAIVRHAEKGSEAQDPGLTAAGKLRAERLAAVFRKAGLDLLIASDLLRTRETLEPLAREKSLKIRAIREPAEVARAVKALRPGSTVLVAHHSFTIREILKDLGVPEAASRAIDLEAHDNLVILAYHPDLEAKLLTLAY